MEINLTGRTALITGGSAGLGLAMAQRMSASGADVAIMARRPEVIDEAVRMIAQTAKGKVLGGRLRCQPGGGHPARLCRRARRPRQGGYPGQ